MAAVRGEFFSSAHCVGSLIKPFLLLAYFKDHPDPIRSGLLGPDLSPCRGWATQQCPVDCWYKPGHGSLDVKRALALSCNQYFYQLARDVSDTSFFEILDQMGLKDETRVRRIEFLRPEIMIGLDERLELVPLQLLRAYLKLLVEPQPSSRLVQTIVAGLQLGAVMGTSALAERNLPINQHLFGKTGTSPAWKGGQYVRDKADGWFVGFYPSRQPTLAVVVYYPQGLGARNAAPLGGKAISAYIESIR